MSTTEPRDFIYLDAIRRLPLLEAQHEHMLAKNWRERIPIGSFQHAFGVTLSLPSALAAPAWTGENWCSELDLGFAGKVRLALWERYGHKHTD